MLKTNNLSSRRASQSFGNLEPARGESSAPFLFPQLMARLLPVNSLAKCVPAMMEMFDQWSCGLDHRVAGHNRKLSGIGVLPRRRRDVKQPGTSSHYKTREKRMFETSSKGASYCAPQAATVSGTGSLGHF